MSHYILNEDVHDNVVNGFDKNNDIEDYLNLADIEMVDLAEVLGVRDTDDIATNDDGTVEHETIQRYLNYYLCAQYCLDRIGGTGTNIDYNEIYRVKHELYNNMAKMERKKISREMVTGVVNEIGDRANITGIVFRG